MKYTIIFVSISTMHVWHTERPRFFAPLSQLFYLQYTYYHRYSRVTYRTQPCDENRKPIHSFLVYSSTHISQWNLVCCLPLVQLSLTRSLYHNSTWGDGLATSFGVWNENKSENITFNKMQSLTLVAIFWNESGIDIILIFVKVTVQRVGVQGVKVGRDFFSSPRNSVWKPKFVQ